MGGVKGLAFDQFAGIESHASLINGALAMVVVKLVIAVVMIFEVLPHSRDHFLQSIAQCGGRGNQSGIGTNHFKLVIMDKLGDEFLTVGHDVNGVIWAGRINNTPWAGSWLNIHKLPPASAMAARACSMSRWPRSDSKCG